MLQSLSAILYLLSGSLVLMVLFQYLRAKVDILSLRNLFLLGFIIFQSNNAARVLWIEYFGEYPVVDPQTTGLKFVFMSVLFLVVFLAAYHSGILVSKFAASRAKAYRTPSVTSMLTLAVVFVMTGVLCRMVLAKLPVYLFPQVFMPIGSGLVFVAVAIAGTAWAPRAFNPVVGGIAAAIVIMAMIPIIGDFSRREILGLSMAFLWGAYHSHWKFMSPGAALMRLAAVGAAGAMLLAAHTAIRGAFIGKQVPIGEVVRMLMGAQIRDGATDLASGQDAGAISMWLIETRPGQYEYDTLHTARLLLTHPVPRKLYPEKPIALAQMVPKQSGSIVDKAETYNVGPGIIGHIANDNPWLTLAPYAIFLGLFLRLLDDLVKWNAANPFVLLPIGVGLGQIVALARGETGHFMFMGMLNMLGAYIAMQLFVRLMTTFGFTMRYDEHAEYTGDGWDDGETPTDPEPGHDWEQDEMAILEHAQHTDYGSDQPST